MILQAYLSIPGKGFLTPGHCQIATLRHAPAYTALDEDECEEIQVGLFLTSLFVFICLYLFCNLSGCLQLFLYSLMCVDCC